VQCGAECVRALHWFNPLVWVACTRLRQESDRACDDLVLASGVDGSDYASHLVDIARLLRGKRAWLPAPAVVHLTGFERRVRAMIDTRVNRRPLSRRAVALTIALSLLVALPIAGLTAGQSLVRFTGSVLDPTNAVLPGAVITLANVDTQARYEVRTDREGRYDIPGLPPGRYLLQTKLPGFQDVALTLTVGEENVHRDLTLEIGTLEETITVVNGAAGAPREMTPEQKARLDEVIRKRAAERCPDAPRVAPPIGGNLRVPIKLRDRKPIYPPDLAAEGIAGKVELDTVIGTDGRVDRITVKSATHQAFADAAIDAVRQWEFDATLLNCVPVETPMNVTANFVTR
jgi:TonB family protein